MQTPVEIRNNIFKHRENERSLRVIKLEIQVIKNFEIQAKEFELYP